jgi:hypothetical protein
MGQTPPFGRHAVMSAVDLKADKPRTGPKVSEVPFSDIAPYSLWRPQKRLASDYRRGYAKDQFVTVMDVNALSGTDNAGSLFNLSFLPGGDPRLFGTRSLRRTKAALIYRRTGDLRAVQLLLGHTKIESTVRFLGSRSMTISQSLSRSMSELPGQGGPALPLSLWQFSATCGRGITSEHWSRSRDRCGTCHALLL